MYLKNLRQQSYARVQYIAQHITSVLSNTCYWGGDYVILLENDGTYKINFSWL